MIYGIILLSITIGIALDRLYLNWSSNGSEANLDRLKAEVMEIVEEAGGHINKLREEVHSKELLIKKGQQNIDSVVDELVKRGYGCPK